MRSKFLRYTAYLTHLIVLAGSIGVGGDGPPSHLRLVQAKLGRLAHQLLKRADLNRDQKIDAAEWGSVSSSTSLPDGNADGAADVDELGEWLAQHGRGRRLWLGPVSTSAAPRSAPQSTAVAAEQADGTRASETAAGSRNTRFVVPAEVAPAGLPEWFLARDADGDGQLTLFEYSPKGTAAELKSFSQLDADGDGVLTASEALVPGVSRRP